MYPGHEIITSFTGLADISGAIVLAEVGDDRARFGDDRALQAFAGSAPVTRASGKSRTVTRRRPKNNRLAAIGYSWEFTTAPHPPVSTIFADANAATGILQRLLFNRMLGQLHHCLQTGQTYDPVKSLPGPGHEGRAPGCAGPRLKRSQHRGLKRSVVLPALEATK